MHSKIYWHRRNHVALLVCGALSLANGLFGQTPEKQAAPARPAPTQQPKAPPRQAATPPARGAVAPAAPARGQTPAARGATAPPAPARGETPAARGQTGPAPGLTNKSPANEGRGSPNNAIREGPASTSRTAFQRPAGPARETPKPGGGSIRQYQNGVQVETDRNGRATHYTDSRNGMDARFDPVSHRPTQIHIKDGVTVQRSGSNGRRVEETIRMRDGGSARVVHSGNWTSVQRAMPGRPGFYQRTVLVGARSYSVVYRSYTYVSVYGPVEFYRPVPAVIFAPAYYTFLISPWPQPVVYTPVAWGWSVQPWFAVYAGFFTPYPSYAAPDQQLTDYLIAANLQETYDNQHAPDAAPVAPPNGGSITLADKSAIELDLKEDLAREKQIAVNPNLDEGALPEALQRREFFVHAAPLEVPAASGATCVLSEGDILRRVGIAPTKDNGVEMMVRLSQADPSHTELCAPQTHVMVQVADLQEMYNHQKEQLAEGEQIIAKQQGAAGPKPIQLANGKTDPDTAGAQAALKQVLSDADDAEKQASAVAGGS